MISSEKTKGPHDKLHSCDLAQSEILVGLWHDFKSLDLNNITWIVIEKFWAFSRAIVEGTGDHKEIWTTRRIELTNPAIHINKEDWDSLETFRTKVLDKVQEIKDSETRARAENHDAFYNWRSPFWAL